MAPLRLSLAVCLLMLGCDAIPGTGTRADSSDLASGAASGTDSAAVAERRAAGSATGPRTYFQYIDERGSVRFVSSLEEVPAQWQERAGRVELSSPPPTSPAARRARLAKRRAAATAVAARQASASVVLYYADWCGYCGKAKSYLERRGVDYQLKDVDQPSVMAELQRKTGSRSIPVLEIGNERVRGFDEARIARLLAKL